MPSITLSYKDVDFCGCEDCENCIAFDMERDIYKCNGNLKQLCRIHLQSTGKF